MTIESFHGLWCRIFINFQTDESFISRFYWLKHFYYLLITSLPQPMLFSYQLHEFKSQQIQFIWFQPLSSTLIFLNLFVCFFLSFFVLFSYQLFHRYIWWIIIISHWKWKLLHTLQNTIVEKVFLFFVSCFFLLTTDFYYFIFITTTIKKDRKK